VTLAKVGVGSAAVSALGKRRQKVRLASSRTANEAAALQGAAEKLRAEAEALEAELGEERWQEQLRWFNAFDANGDGKVDVAELQEGMKSLRGKFLDRHTAAQILKELDVNENGVLEADEFNVVEVEARLERIASEREEKRQADARLQDAEAKTLDAVELALEGYLKLPARNNDIGPTTRLLSMCVYILPIMEIMRFLLPLTDTNAEMAASLSLLFTMEQTGMAPVARISLFFLFQFLSEDRALPHLLRFNLRQAVTIDVALGCISLLELFYSASTNNALVARFEAEHWDGNFWVIALFIGCVCYSIALSCAGKLPKQIPVISGYAQRTMSPTRPRWVDEVKIICAKKKEFRDEKK